MAYNVMMGVLVAGLAPGRVSLQPVDAPDPLGKLWQGFGLETCACEALTFTNATGHMPDILAHVGLSALQSLQHPLVMPQLVASAGRR